MSLVKILKPLVCIAVEVVTRVQDLIGPWIATQHFDNLIVVRELSLEALEDMERLWDDFIADSEYRHASTRIDVTQEPLGLGWFPWVALQVDPLGGVTETLLLHIPEDLVAVRTPGVGVAVESECNVPFPREPHNRARRSSDSGPRHFYRRFSTFGDFVFGHQIN